MIRAYFNFKVLPFQKNTIPDQLYQSQSFKEGLKRLEYLKQNRGIMLLTGNSGVGKSTLIRTFSDSLGAQHYKICYIPLASVSILDFYRQLNFFLTGINLHQKAALFFSIQEAIRNFISNRKLVPVFLFDEAHLFKNDNFFELQMILNFDFDSICPAIIVLIAQSHLRERLARDFLYSFNRRISLKFHLIDLNKSESLDFIKHSIAIVGGSPDVFSTAALDVIYSNSQGNLSMISKLAFNSLFAAASSNKKIVSEEEVYLASKEL
ncbi:MAG: AAA family ATPase [Deltaproteobacteria bacterium]